MALSNEDHKDVKKAMGKALANKVAKVTMDGKTNLHVGGKTSHPFRQNVRVRPKSSSLIGRLESHKANHPDAGGKPKKGESYIQYLERHKSEGGEFD